MLLVEGSGHLDLDRVLGLGFKHGQSVYPTSCVQRT